MQSTGPCHIFAEVRRFEGAVTQVLRDSSCVGVALMLPSLAPSLKCIFLRFIVSDIFGV